MTDWSETYRGAVPPWQCDVTEHFTVAYYFERLEEAAANLADALGLGDLSRSGAFPRRIDARFARELREGASLHVESAALGVDDGAGTHLRLGHRFVDSATGEVVTWFDEHWDLAATPLPAERRQAIDGQRAEWNGPAAEKRQQPTTFAGFIPTGRGRVRPGDVEASGRFGLGAIVHRFSNASAQTGAAIGFDAEYMQRNRRGFSTFELGLLVSGALRLDEPWEVRSGIGHLGNSSLRMIHRMTHARTGAEIARLSQYGVNLDLDARRPARWPDDVRDRASGMVVPVE